MNRWLVLWHDGNRNRASLVDFGDDPTSGPLGNEQTVIESLGGGDILINGMVKLLDIDSDDPCVVVIDDNCVDIGNAVKVL